ncbi:hypothetical protein [Neisseria lactamica]|uniref:hypothetical protein n=1 Tax=Neisseria lactamica TaxID=486 RepID=UPI00031124A6|nr:hypothetical protein [Neisseria lactamica]
MDEQKSGQGDEAADSTNSTEPIHLVLQHLRESFSLSQGEATPYRFLLVHYTSPKTQKIETGQTKFPLREDGRCRLKDFQTA